MAARFDAKHISVPLHIVLGKNVSIASPHPSHYVKRFGEAKTEGRGLHRKNNKNNLKNQVQQSVRTSAVFNLLYHGDISSLQQISSLITRSKKLTLLPLLGLTKSLPSPVLLFLTKQQ